MHRNLIVTNCVLLISFTITYCCKNRHDSPPPGLDDGAPLLLVHGGAGTIPPEWEEPKHRGMKAAVRAGYKVLEDTGSVLDAVEAAIKVMEDDEAFNAGRGSKLNIFGQVEMDASLMEGESMKAGAVASIGGFRHPISAARVVMDNSSHVLVVGEGAERLARKFGVEEVGEDWLITNYSRYLLDEYLKQHNLTHLGKEEMWSNPILGRQGGTGTVGAVAYLGGHLAAGTSTGGITGKLPGRVGDSPLVGQGVFADDDSVAVSCTGTGETFMRAGVARRVGYKVEEGSTAQEAVGEALGFMKHRVGGNGGAIAVDKLGQIGIEWNSEMMAWAWGRSGKLHYGVHRGEDFVEDL